MNISKKLGVAALIGCSAIGLLLPKAVGQPTTPQPNCTNPQTTADIHLCLGQEYRNADRRLNQLYQQLQTRLPVNRRQKLVTSQQAWIQFRDAACDFSSSRYAGGSLEPVRRTDCLTRLTRQRVQDLEEALRPDS